MGNKEINIALSMIDQLYNHDFHMERFEDQLGQVDQGYNTVADMIDALSIQSHDSRLEALANLVRQAWTHT
jgi:hypothetical protein